MNALFGNRTEAGLALADLVGKNARSNATVLGLSKGGTLVAAELAHWLGATMDFLPVRTLDLPCGEKTTFGAVGPGGVCVLDDEVIDLLDIESDAIGTLRCEADAAIAQENRSLRGGRPLPNVRDQTVIVVDEVIASTLKVRAAVLYLHQQAPHSVIVVAPVILKPVLHDLRSLVDDLVAVDEPESAPDIGLVYVDPTIPTDAEIRRVLGVSEPTDDVLAGSSTDDA